MSTFVYENFSLFKGYVKKNITNYNDFETVPKGSNHTYKYIHDG